MNSRAFVSAQNDDICFDMHDTHTMTAHKDDRRQKKAMDVQAVAAAPPKRTILKFLCMLVAGSVELNGNFLKS